MEYQIIGLVQNFSMHEIVLVLAVVLLFFGAKRLPGLFNSLGRSIREFKNGVGDVDSEAPDVFVESKSDLKES